MRQGTIIISLSLFFFLSILLTPFYLQWSYRARLVHAVGIGSTKDEYLKALIDSHLGQGDIRPGFTFWRPFQAHGFVYTIFAYPEWDSSGRLSGYIVFTQISLRGHIYFLPHSKEPGFQSLF